jgi:hypothetical protein
MYDGALADMSLGTDPYTGNRYAFTAGNPINLIEADGHLPCKEGISDACGESLLGYLASPSNVLVETPKTYSPAVTKKVEPIRTPLGKVVSTLALVLSLSGDTPQHQQWELKNDEESQKCLTRKDVTSVVFNNNPDGENRATGGFACLHQATAHELDSSPPGTPVGWESGMDRSHLIARQFGGGSTANLNIVPMHPMSNQRGMRSFERSVENALKDEQRVFYSSIPVYKPGEIRPLGVWMHMRTSSTTKELYVPSNALLWPPPGS